MKVYARQLFNTGIEVKSKESLEKEKQELIEQYYHDKEMFFEWLDEHYSASDFYQKDIDEPSLMAEYRINCERNAHYDTFGQYKEVELQ